ncbi:MAG: hypothetical protein AAGC57_16615 [Pseudomonadota bacterium]
MCFLAQAATLITLADFEDPLVEDFEGVMLGAISESSAVFSDLGITGVTARPDAAEPYDDRAT